MDICPQCGQPVPPNEWASYRKHEDCANIPQFITGNGFHKHPLGGIHEVPFDRHRRNDKGTQNS